MYWTSFLQIPHCLLSIGSQSIPPGPLILFLLTKTVQLSLHQDHLSKSRVLRYPYLVIVIEFSSINCRKGLSVAHCLLSSSIRSTIQGWVGMKIQVISLELSLMPTDLTMTWKRFWLDFDLTKQVLEMAFIWLDTKLFPWVDLILSQFLPPMVPFCK